MPTAVRTIDAHCHVWPAGTSRFALAPGVAPGERQPADYPIETHLARLADIGITATVLVPHIAFYGRDLSYLHDCAARFPGRCAVMGAITGAEVAEPQGLATDIARGVRAFRIRAADMAQPMDALCQTLVQADAVLCPLITRAQAVSGALGMVDDLAGRHPQLRIVLDHFGGAHASPALHALARRPNIMLKVSDFGAFDIPPYTVARAATLTLCALFGAHRLMWASNMPVFDHDTRQDLAAAWQTIATAEALSASERAAILGGTADTVFFPH